MKFYVYCCLLTVFFNFAQMLVDTQEYAKADAYFIKASVRDPKNAAIQVYRGLLQLQWKNDIAAAKEYIQNAIDLDDKCEFAYETLGTIEVQWYVLLIVKYKSAVFIHKFLLYVYVLSFFSGRLKEAISLFDKALALARTAMELSHIFGLQDAAKAQLVVSERLGSEMFQSLQG